MSVAEAIYKLVSAAQPETSYLGIGLTISSLVLMPLLGRMKHRLGASLDSAATAGEGTQNILCAYLAAAVLLGLLANTLFGFWWLDPVAALAVAALAVREGQQSWRGEGLLRALLTPESHSHADDHAGHTHGVVRAGVTPSGGLRLSRGKGAAAGGRPIRTSSRSRACG